MQNYLWAADIGTLNDPCEAMINTDTYYAELHALEELFVPLADVSDNFATIRCKVDELKKKALSAGIFSLTKDHSDELMWSHYAMAHQGFCIGYNMRFLERSF